MVLTELRTQNLLSVYRRELAARVQTTYTFLQVCAVHCSSYFAHLAEASSVIQDLIVPAEALQDVVSRWSAKKALAVPDTRALHVVLLGKRAVSLLHGNILYLP